MTYLITGGAGYIGSHIVQRFRAAGLDVVVVDDLSTGRKAFLPDDVPFVEASILDTAAVRRALQEHDVRCVVHMAGFKFPGESMKRPLFTYEQNVTGTASVLTAMEEADVEALVFSSSCSIYGTPDVEWVTEDTAPAPESPYGESKLIGEWLIRDVARATGLKQTSLRYFNVVGSGHPTLFDVSPHNLFPLVIDALREGRTPRINGDDYATPDGTCVRDYVHVSDLAEAHVTAARALVDGRTLAPVYNLGSGEGLSVRQIMDAFRDVTGIDFVPEIGVRRPGDPARIVAAGELAARDLAWSNRSSVEQMVESAWQAGA